MNPALEAYLRDCAEQVNHALDEYLIAPPGSPPTLIEAMRYSALAPGKRLRPALAIAGAEAVGGTARQVMPTACALELIHAFSLVHDDLPALDNDDLRRGLPTSHIKYGEALAILAGDALLAMAFELIGRNVEIAPPLNVCRALRVISQATGTDGMVAGQVLDILSENLPPDAERLDYIHQHKTAALMRASVSAGAILCGASEQQIWHLERYGMSIGVAFQIADDLLNVTSDAQTLGKAVNSDAQRGKQTYPLVFGLEASRRKALELVNEAKSALELFGEKARPLALLADYIIDRQA